VYRSADRGEHWEKVEMPDHGLPVWSILFHPHDPDVILVGCENCEIYRSDDAGERWTRLPVSVRFPEITTAPGANPAKRVLMMDASASQPDHLYGAIEVGGTIRSTAGGGFQSEIGALLHSRDGGDSWARVETGFEAPHTMFALAFDERQPSRMSCATNGGEVYTSLDAGETWTVQPPPPGGTQVYALA